MDPYLQAMAAAAVIGALLFASRTLRRGTARPFARRGPAKILETLERVSLNPQLSIHVIRIGERRLAIAAHSSGVTILDAWGDAIGAERTDPETRHEDKSGAEIRRRAEIGEGVAWHETGAEVQPAGAFAEPQKR